MALKLDLADLDAIAAVHAPHLAPPDTGFAPGSPEYNMGLGATAQPSMPSPKASPAGAPEMASPSFAPPSGEPAGIQRPTAKEGHEAGKAEFRAGMPTITESDASAPGFYSQRIAQEEYKKEHPWGSPISEHPGFLGKVAHGLATAGNIAGDILAPSTMGLIPGTQMNRGLKEAGLQQGLEKTTEETTARKAVDQRPEIAEQKGELQGRLQAEKEDEQQKRLQNTLDSQETRADQREQGAEKLRQSANTEAEKRQTAHDAEAEKRQRAQFAEQEKLLDMRETNKKADAKPTADEQRRADLSENLNENLATLEEIVHRRPDLFGPAAGRWTSLKAALGSGDPDIATLETIKHQIGMAQISAHGMRSAQGIGAAADSILNSFKNEPAAVLASINAARNSVKTFTGDVEKVKGGGKTETPAKKGDPLGIL